MVGPEHDIAPTGLVAGQQNVPGYPLWKILWADHFVHGSSPPQSLCAWGAAASAALLLFSRRTTHWGGRAAASTGTGLRAGHGDQPPLQGSNNRLRAALDVQLFEYSLQMKLDGVATDVHARGHLDIRGPGGEQPQHLNLTRCQEAPGGAWMRLSGACGHGTHAVGVRWLRCNQPRFGLARPPGKRRPRARSSAHLPPSCRFRTPQGR